MQQSVTRPASSPERPTTVTVMAILAVIGGVGIVLGVLAGAFLIHGLSSLDPTDAIIVGPGLVLAAVYLAFARGAWNLQPRGWTLGVVAAAATIAYTVIILVVQWGELMRDAPPLAVMGLLVAAVTAVGLFFWFRPEVKAAFDRD